MFRRVLDAEMKSLNRSGEAIREKRKRVEKKPVGDEDERLLWSKELLGDKTAESLLHTIYFYVGKLFGLRPCEHRQLRLSNFVVEENTITYRENISKTFHGGLKDLKKKARTVTHYCHSDNVSGHEPCLVEMFKQYISLVRDLERADDAFYFRPSRGGYKFENSPLGVHKLNSIVPTLMEEAGLEKKTAHCLRVTTATSLFREKHDEKLIRDRTGHISSALFSYEKANKEQEIAVSKTLGPCVSKDIEAVSEEIAIDNNEGNFNLVDDELDKILSEYDLSQFENTVQKDNSSKYLMLSSNTFNNCTVNISFNEK